MTELLPIIWYIIICAELALYIMLDGANLGVGILTLIPQKEKVRARILDTLGPIWNANETWLLVAAGTLFGAFPLAYSVGLNALYVPGVIVLVGLALRAVSFEFHSLARKKQFWSFLFGFGSLITVVGQGAMLGGLVSGIPVVEGVFAGTAFGFLTPITVLMVIGTVGSYLVLGYAYLIKRMDYENAKESFRDLLLSVGLTFLALLSATFFLPNTSYVFFERWTTAPSMYYLIAIGLGIAVTGLLLGISVLTGKLHKHLHTMCLIIFGLGFVGMLIGTYPYLLPPSVTLFEAASPSNTLQFMLWGIGPILPIILVYNFYLHRIFSRRGEEETY